MTRYLLAVQSLALLFAAGTWWQAWRCLCKPALEIAAFWTGVAAAQSVVLIGVFALRMR